VTSTPLVPAPVGSGSQPRDVASVGIRFQWGSQRLEIVRWWSMAAQGKARRPLFRQDPPALGVEQRRLRENELSLTANRVGPTTRRITSLRQANHAQTEWPRAVQQERKNDEGSTIQLQNST